MSAIIAKLGLDAKGFRKDLDSVAARVSGFAKKSGDDLRKTSAASNTLGTSFTQIGKSWVSGAVGAFSGAVAFTSIYQGIKAAKEMKKSLTDALTHTSGNFTGIEEMQRRLEATNKAAKDGADYLDSTFNQAVLGWKSFAKVVASPIDAWKGKVGFTDDLVAMEKQVQALKKQELDLQIKIAEKEQVSLINKRIGIEISESYAEKLEAERKLKEKIGAANKQPVEAREKLRENARAEYEMEIALIEKKAKSKREDLELQTKIVALQGSESQKGIKALELEIGLLKKRLETKRAMNVEEREAIALQVKQKEKQLTDSRVEEFSKSPQQRQQEHQQGRQTARQREAYEREVADVKSAMDRGVTGMTGKRGRIAEGIKDGSINPNDPLGVRDGAAKEAGKGAGDIAADERRAARAAEFDKAFGKNPVTKGIQSASKPEPSKDPGIKVLEDIRDALNEIKKKEIGNL